MSAPITPACTHPWTDVYVSFEGEVFACCLSRHALGNLADNTAAEIWGAGMDVWRAQMETGLPPTCAKCPILPMELGKQPHDILNK